jgi:hypothetical protein
MGDKKTRQRSGNSPLKPERTAQSNKPARLGLHSKSGLLGSFCLNDCGPRMLENFLADLG